MAKFQSPGHYTAEDRNKIPASDFGDPSSRKYPIVTQQDVTDAAKLIGHADDPEAVKARIKAIAKEKGFSLPKDWQDGDERTQDADIETIRELMDDPIFRSIAADLLRTEDKNDGDDSEEEETDEEPERTQTADLETIRAEIATLLDEEPLYRATVMELLRADDGDNEDDDDGLEEIDSDLDGAEDIDDVEDKFGADGGMQSETMNPPTSPTHPEAVGAGVKTKKRTTTPAIQRSATVVEIKNPIRDGNIYIPITRIDREKREVSGVVSDEGIDTFDTIFDYPSMKRAVQERWHGNVREQHDPRKAVGRGVQAYFDDDSKTTTIKARISKGAEDTWQKILDGTLNGFSIGASNAKTETRMVNGRPVLTYKDFGLAEISVVDAPSNPGAAKSGLTIYRAAQADAPEMYSDSLEMEDTMPTLTTVSAGPAAFVGPVALPSPVPVVTPVPVAAPSAASRMPTPQDRTTTDRMIGAMTEEPLSPAEIAAIAGVTTAGLTRNNAPGSAPPATMSAVASAAPVPNVTNAAPQSAADYDAIDAKMNVEPGNVVAHVHTHPYSKGDTHMNNHSHQHVAHHRAIDGDSHTHAHMHAHADGGDGRDPHIHLHDHGHEYRSAAPDVDQFGVIRFNAFIGERNQDLVRAACAQYGIAYPGETRMDTTTGADTSLEYEKGQISQSAFDGQKVITTCPGCQRDAATTGLSRSYFAVGETCPICQHVFVPGDTIPSTVAEMSAVPRTQASTTTPPAVKATDTSLTRAGKRISGDTSTGIHAAISQLAHTCAGDDGADCPHCRAILAVLDPDNDGDDDLDESLDTDNDGDEMGNRVRRAQLTRSIHRIVASEIQQQIAPVVQRLQSVSARLATQQQTPDLTRMTDQLAEQHALLKAVVVTVEQMAAAERPGGPIVRVADKTLMDVPQRSQGVTPFTPDQIDAMRRHNINLQQSYNPVPPNNQVGMAQEIFKRQQ